MSRNGCDQINSSAASRIAARVRSDLPILGVGSGVARGLGDDLLISDMVSYIIRTMSVGQTARSRRERRQYNGESGNPLFPGNIQVNNKTMRLLSFISAVCFILGAHVAIAEPMDRFKVADTSSPRDTLRSFIEAANDSYDLIQKSGSTGTALMLTCS